MTIRPLPALLRAALLGSVGLFSSLSATAQDCVIPPTNDPVRVTQADGSAVLLRLMGSGLHNWYEDLNGYAVLRIDGGYQYALQNATGQLEASGMLVGKSEPSLFQIPRGIVPSPRTNLTTGGGSGASNGGAQTGLGASSANSSLPFLSGTGTVKNLVVLLRFSDHGPGGQNRTLPSTSDVGKIMNAVGGDPVLAPTGSLRDHYLETSYGQLTIDSTVTIWVDVPNTEIYYANGNSGLTSRTWELITDGLNLADASVDFSQFDADGDGVIDAITFLHSGYGAEWGGTDQYGTHYSNRMWSHKWSIPTWTSAEGVSVSEYNISPGLWGTSGSGPGRIGVVAHELGHFFGLPDIYDTDGSSSGSGNWALMAAGSWGFDGSQRYPSHLSAWSKMKMGWLMPETLLPGSYSVARVEDTPTVYKIDNGYPPGEYLLVANRAAFGFDAKIPVEGLAIWHVDETKGSFGQNNPNTDEGYPGQSGWPGNGKHYRVALLQADNNFNLEHKNNRGDSGDLYNASGVNSISGSSSPNTDAYQQGALVDNGNAISNIGSPGLNVTMTLTSPQAPSITSVSLLAGNVGQAYADSLSSSGGDAPLVWSEHLVAPTYSVSDLGASLYSATGNAQNWNADEDIWALTLPFAFPFYDGSYSTCYVSSNGFLEFAPTESEPYNSPYTLRASRRIAPLWDDLRTDASGSHDIFVDTSVAGQVQVRWRGETTASGNAVNFSVVLFANGDLRFDYGSGNTGLSPNVGISRGEGGIYDFPTSHDGASSLTDANSILFSLSGSQLPPGLSLSPAGVLSGTPTLAGSYTPSFRVTDNKYRYDIVQLSVQVGSGGPDCNNNGIPDATDITSGTSQDCNGSGVPDECELAGNDCNTDGIPDDCQSVSNDCNLNGVPDDCELAGNDCNSNGIPDECDTDCNANGTPDDCESITDCNSNGVPDECELGANDCNSNGVPDECDVDCNSNGTPDDCESTVDCNTNGIPDECELGGNDCNSNLVPDDCETDCNLNGMPDDCESITDCNGDGVPDECELAGNDCNLNGIPDECDTDCNLNSIPDDCETITDCNADGVPDECQLAANDCNLNGVPDECDTDCNLNGMPDDCESITDCNQNGIPDECELAGNDCNLNGVPDECDTDCNLNQTPDDCESFTDCNTDGVPDECQLSSNDCNLNGIPDECDTDCNLNGMPDDCEGAADCNSNGIPDECDISSGTSNDADGNGVPDECSTGTPYCFGDGTGTACPCGNTGAPGAGCANSLTSGAVLLGSGSTSVATDDLTLTATGLLPGQSALLFSGLTQVNGGAGATFGDGLRCAGGPITRLTVQVPDSSGTAVWGTGLAGTYGWNSGQTRTFQTWYRDTSGSPCGNSFNVSNGLSVTFTP